MTSKPALRAALLASVALLATPAFAAGASVKVLDKTFDVGAGMFAYTEYELSGEPLAESLGLDLDVLDADQADKPTAFDFAAGIDSYEYSEEAMYAVNYQSRLGPHLVNGPVNAAAAGRSIRWASGSLRSPTPSASRRTNCRRTSTRSPFLSIAPSPNTARQST